LDAEPLYDRANIRGGADETIGKRKVEMRGFVARRHFAAEKPLVDVRAYNGLVAGAVRRDQQVEQRRVARTPTGSRRVSIATSSSARPKTSA
jgi:hypothetical protein